RARDLARHLRGARRAREGREPGAACRPGWIERLESARRNLWAAATPSAPAANLDSPISAAQKARFPPPRGAWTVANFLTLAIRSMPWSGPAQNPYEIHASCGANEDGIAPKRWAEPSIVRFVTGGRPQFEGYDHGRKDRQQSQDRQFVDRGKELVVPDL